MQTISVEHEGATLEDLFGQGPLTASNALRHGLRLAIALRAIHDKGEVCGALDPARVRFAGDEAVIQAGAPVNGPYTAPELLAGATADVRSDIFGFGAVLYRMLTGRLPFPGNSPEEIARSIREDPPAPLGALMDDAGQADAAQFPGLERLIFQCLEKKPEQRWPRVRSVCTELKLLNSLTGRLHPVADSRPSLEERFREQIARLEASVEARVAACERSVAGLEGLFIETCGRLRSSVDSLQERVQSQGQSIDGLHSAVSRMDDLMERVVESIAASDGAVAETQQACNSARAQLQHFTEDVEARFTSQNESVDAIRASFARAEDLLERVVESIDSLQGFVLERTAASRPL